MKRTFPITIKINKIIICLGIIIIFAEKYCKYMDFKAKLFFLFVAYFFIVCFLYLFGIIDANHFFIEMGFGLFVIVMIFIIAFLGKLILIVLDFIISFLEFFFKNYIVNPIKKYSDDIIGCLSLLFLLFIFFLCLQGGCFNCSSSHFDPDHVHYDRF